MHKATVKFDNTEKVYYGSTEDFKTRYANPMSSFKNEDKKIWQLQNMKKIWQLQNMEKGIEIDLLKRAKGRSYRSNGKKM